jgi:hypothetical protein
MDGVVMIWEDGLRLEELTNGKGKVGDKTYEELAEVKFIPTSNFACLPYKITTKSPKASSDACELRIPKLQDLLPHMQRVAFTMELPKVGGTECAERVQELLRRQIGETCKITYSSRDLSTVAFVAALGEPKVKTEAAFEGNLPSDFADVAANAGASRVAIRYDQVTAANASEVKGRGLEMCAWFPGTRAMKEADSKDSVSFDHLLECGAGIVISTNEPDVLANLVQFRSGKKSGKKRKTADSASPTRPTRKRVRFDVAQSIVRDVREIRDVVDRTGTSAVLYHCDECGVQFQGGLRKFEIYFSCSTCGEDDDGYDLCRSCWLKTGGKKHEGGRHVLKEVDRNDDSEELEEEKDASEVVEYAERLDEAEENVGSGANQQVVAEDNDEGN